MDRTRVVTPLLIFGAVLTLYVATLAPTVQWGDFGGFQTRVSLGELELGAFGHPLWNLLTRPFTLLPFGDMAYRVNLSAAFFAALALAAFYRGALHLTRSPSASVLATLALGISHTFWTYAVVPKAYSLTLLLLALSVWLLLQWRDSTRRWQIALVGALLGLGVMNHLIALTALPGVLLFVWWHAQRRTQDLAVFAFAFGVALVPYLWLLSSAPAKGMGTGSFIVLFVTKFFDLLASPRDLLLGIAFTIANLGYQYLLLTFVGAWGWWLLFRRDRSLAAMLLLIALGDVAFVLVPTTPPIMQLWHLYHPAYLVFAYALAIGMSALLARWGDGTQRRLAWSAAIIASALLIYFVLAPTSARAIGITERLGVRDFPGRDTVTFLFTPSKAGDVGARQYGESVFQSLPPHAALFADWTPYAPLWYLQAVEGYRPDVSLLELPDKETLLSAVNRYAGRPVFLADVSRYYDLASVETQYRIAHEGLLYRLLPKEMP